VETVEQAAPVPTARFTVDEAQAAADEWGANCGPGALAGVLGLTLSEVRSRLVGFEEKGHTNPTMIYSALELLGVKYRRVRKPTEWPRFGLVRIQWGGPWMAPKVPGFVRYMHTHWVGAATADSGAVQVFDINCICSGGWVPLDEWSWEVVPRLLKEIESKGDGTWSIAGVVEVTPATGGKGEGT
jgi:hypothetical protein